MRALLSECVCVCAVVAAVPREAPSALRDSISVNNTSNDSSDSGRGNGVSDERDRLLTSPLRTGGVVSGSTFGDLEACIRGMEDISMSHAWLGEYIQRLVRSRRALTSPI